MRQRRPGSLPSPPPLLFPAPAPSSAPARPADLPRPVKVTEESDRKATTSKPPSKKPARPRNWPWGEGGPGRLTSTERPFDPLPTGAARPEHPVPLSPPLPARVCSPPPHPSPRTLRRGQCARPISRAHSSHVLFCCLNCLPFAEKLGCHS